MAKKNDPSEGPPSSLDPKRIIPDLESTEVIPDIGDDAGQNPSPNLPPGRPLYPDHDIGLTARQPEISNVNQPTENPGRDFGHPIESENLDVQGDFGDTSTSKLVPLRREEQAAEKEARLNREDAPLSRFNKGDRQVLDDVIRRQDEDAAASEETEGEDDSDFLAFMAGVNKRRKRKENRQTQATPDARESTGDPDAWESTGDPNDPDDIGSQTNRPVSGRSSDDARESGGKTDEESSDSDKKDESKEAMSQLSTAINALSESVRLNTGAVDVLRDQTQELTDALSESMEASV